ncbi:gamma-glutamyl-gamma-aminobutyrate hydrolase family protein [Rhizobium vallis]|uniref:Gamma-glutamyl-gamma-aminobutyrate hydrolase family protein n=1 Tax=Rhizobium vallis TaxID=634290 RepID=A0A3S0QRN4_9HYPH|nr:gamma-glutamyl-gamma-aminobutyrate hydrolase family protein [Rhizobium vallis]RUM20518.1 gamma-glutamyl-gamma-aminobutyrate hydrolase family protein [Rhizobium vallis]
MTKATLSYPEPDDVGALQILVAGSLMPPGASDTLKTALTCLADNVLSELAACGANGSFLETSCPGNKAAALLDGKQGLLVLGGADADPSCYGQMATSDTIYGLNVEVDKFELDLMASAQAHGIPVLGICRGMQLMNVLRGGDLVQDIGSDTIHVGNDENSVMVSHLVQIADGSRLSSIYADKQISVQSAHHQAVNRVGNRLTIAAQAGDGLVEALENAGDHWMVGVQWHPEAPNASKQDFRSLIEHFLLAAGDRARSRH